MWKTLWNKDDKNKIIPLANSVIISTTITTVTATAGTTNNIITTNTGSCPSSPIQTKSQTVVAPVSGKPYNLMYTINLNVNSSRNG